MFQVGLHLQMGKSWKVTNNDLDFTSGGGFSFVSDGEQLAQKIKIGLGKWFGEWFLDNEDGVNYKDIIFKRGVKDQEIQREIQKNILKHSEVTAILSYNLLRVNDTLTVSCKVNSIFGLLPIQVELLA
jgi:hypothetical protein